MIEAVCEVFKLLGLTQIFDYCPQILELRACKGKIPNIDKPKHQNSFGYTPKYRYFVAPQA